MPNTIYITAGLPVAKNAGQSPSAGVNTVYITAGLPPQILEEEESTPTQLLNRNPFFSTILCTQSFVSRIIK